MLIITDTLRIPRTEFTFDFTRSSGAGGQNVNKVNTKVTLRWRPDESTALPPAVRDRLVRKYSRRINSAGEFCVMSQRYREQKRNLDDCLQKLRGMILAVLQPPKKRIKTRPTRASQERRRSDKVARSQKKKARSQKPIKDQLD